MMLSTKLIVIFTSTNCTLNCKLCSTAIPIYRKHGLSFEANPSQINKSIDEIFNIYSYVERFDISGGEPLLFGDDNLIECLVHMNRYRNHFKSVRILTNGTVLPSNYLLSALSRLDFEIGFMIDNYGELSPRVREIERLCSEFNIITKTIPYCGDEQWYGGWVNIFGDLSNRNYSQQEMHDLFAACHIAHEMVLFLHNGRLYQCPTCPLVEQLKGVNDDKAYIPLADNSMSLEEKVKIAEQFGKRIPEACNYCNGFDSKNAIRYKAAEQLQEGNFGI